MAVSSFGVVTASAYVNENNNNIFISTESVTSDIITTNGSVVPEGSTAVTISINRNTGFISKSVKLDLGTAEIVKDENGSVIVETGEVLENSLINGAENNGIAAFAIATATENVSDGDIFTFYTTESTDISILDVDFSIAVNHINIPMANELRWYTIGDIDNNGYINACDASDILGAVRLYEERYNKLNGSLPIDIANNDLPYYFPYRNVDRAEVADTDKNLYINSYDAENVLDYYSALAVGNQPEDIHIAFVGEMTPYVQESSY